MNDYFNGAFFAFECATLIYTIYILVNNEGLKRNNAYLKRCLEDEKHKNYSRQIEKAVIKGELAVKEQEIKLLREQLERHEGNT